MVVYVRPCAADLDMGVRLGLSKSLGSSLLSMVRSFAMVELVVVSPISAISSARANSDISKDVTSGATTKSDGCTPAEFMLKP